MSDYLCKNCEKNNHGWCKVTNSPVTKVRTVCPSSLKNPTSVQANTLNETDISNIAETNTFFHIAKATNFICQKYKSPEEQLNAILQQIYGMATLSVAKVELNDSLKSSSSELDRLCFEGLKEYLEKYNSEEI